MHLREILITASSSLLVPLTQPFSTWLRDFVARLLNILCAHPLPLSEEKLYAPQRRTPIRLRSGQAPVTKRNAEVMKYKADLCDLLFQLGPVRVRLYSLTTLCTGNTLLNVPSTGRYLRFGIAILVIVGAMSYLAFTGIQESKSYYVTIKELQGMGDQARRLRVAGQVVPGSIRRQGAGADFQIDEQGLKLQVAYRGTEPPPDTFKDNAQALVEGSYGKDSVFHAQQIQAKCASKYAPAANQNGTAAEAQASKPAMGQKSN